MNRLPLLLAVLLFSLTPRAQADDPQAPNAAAPSPPVNPPAPKPESLHDLRLQVAHGKLADSAALCDRLAAGYEQMRDAEIAQHEKQGYADSLMAGYCRYLKSQVLSLKGDFPGAEGALQEAATYRAQHPETKLKGLVKIWQEIDSVSNGLLLEKKGRLDDAVKVYSEVNDSPKATGRLAALEFRRGHIDQAKSWAYIHADDPTSEYVLAEVAFKAKSYGVAQRHVAGALGQLQKALATSSEYMPVYYCEMPDLIALRGKLQPLLPKPAPKPPSKVPSAPPAASQPLAAPSVPIIP